MDFRSIELLTPGWVALHLDGPGEVPKVLVKFVEREGRSVIARMVILGEALDSATLRAIPIGRVESVLNPPGFAPLLPKPLDESVLKEMAERGELFPDEFGAIDAALDSFERKHKGSRMTVRRKPRRKPLTRPDGTDPEGFSRRVAQAYAEAVATTPHPAKVLADEAGVPVTTVHRWILEARRRGFLPRARKGRAG